MSIGWRLIPKGRPLPGKGELRSIIDSEFTRAVDAWRRQFQQEYDKKVRDVVAVQEAAKAAGDRLRDQLKTHEGLVKAVKAYRAWIVDGEGETSAKAVAERMEAVWKALEEIEKCSTSSVASSK